jgi:hypothetical protein
VSEREVFMPLDREQAFLIYATFTGDLERTAAALNVRPMDVLRVADEENWNEKLKPILELSKSAKPGDVEKAINRALNFVQAHRLRMIIERIIKRLTGMSADELEEYVFAARDEDGKRFSKLSTRAVADLSSALEKCHAMSYLALGDSGPERARKPDADSKANMGDMNVRIAEAMRKAAKGSSPRVQLFDAQLEIGQKCATPAPPLPLPSPEVPTNPNDNDDH